eukprot:g3377.t1
MFRQELCVVEKQVERKRGGRWRVVNSKGKQFEVAKRFIVSVMGPEMACPWMQLSDNEGAAGGAGQKDGGEEGGGGPSGGDNSVSAAAGWLGGVEQRCDGLVRAGLGDGVAHSVWRSARSHAASGGFRRSKANELVELLFGNAAGGSAPPAPAHPGRRVRPVVALDGELSATSQEERVAAATMLLRTPLYTCFFTEGMGGAYAPVSKTELDRNIVLGGEEAGKDVMLFAKRVFHRLVEFQGGGNPKKLAPLRRSFPALRDLREKMSQTGTDATAAVKNWDPSRANTESAAISAAFLVRNSGEGGERQRQEGRKKDQVGQQKGRRKRGAATDSLQPRHKDRDALRLQRLRLYSASPPFTRRRDAFATQLFRRLGFKDPPEPLAVGQLLELARLDEDQTLLGVRHLLERSGVKQHQSRRERQAEADFLEANGAAATHCESDNVEGTARRAASLGPSTDRDRQGRADLTHLQVIAIDAASTRDVDDGISFERDADGNDWVWVHIADVDRWLPPLRAGLLNGAKSQLQSVYLPHGTYHMFPEAVSTDTRFFSLGGDGDHDVLSFGMQLAADGSIARYEIVPAVVNNVRRITYDQVDALLAGGEPASDSSGGVWGWARSFFGGGREAAGASGSSGFTDAEVATLRSLDAVRRLRAAWRSSNGASDVALTNHNISVRQITDENAAPATATDRLVARSPGLRGSPGCEIEIKLDGRTAAQEMVAEMMIMTNELQLLPDIALCEAEHKDMERRANRIWMLEFLRCKQAEAEVAGETLEFEAVVASDEHDVFRMRNGTYKYQCYIPSLAFFTNVVALNEQDVPKVGTTKALRLRFVKPTQLFVMWEYS